MKKKTCVEERNKRWSQTKVSIPGSGKRKGMKKWKKRQRKSHAGGKGKVEDCVETRKGN